MRFSEEQVRDLFRSGNRDLRDSALDYFVRGNHSDPRIVDEAIDAIERFGWAEAFTSNQFALLAHTERSIAWALNQLHVQAQSSEWSRVARIVEIIFLNADPALTAPHAEAIDANEDVDDWFCERFRRRLDSFALTEEALWTRYDELMTQISLRESQPDVVDEPEIAEEDEAANPLEALDEILVVLAVRFRPVERMMAMFAESHEIESTRVVCLCNAAIMAGWMRYEPAIEPLVKAFEVDQDILNDNLETALARINSERVIDAVEAAYSTAPEYVRHNLISLLGRIHSDRAVQVGLNALLTEPDPSLQTLLASNVVLQFSTEAIEASRPFADDANPFRFDLRFNLVVAAEAMGYELPEAASWKSWMDSPRERLRDLGFDPDLLEHPERILSKISDKREESLEYVPALTPIAEAGRNDPCPCGSGKKHKKCCMRKIDPAQL